MFYFCSEIAKAMFWEKKTCIFLLWMITESFSLPHCVSLFYLFHAHLLSHQSGGNRWNNETNTKSGHNISLVLIISEPTFEYVSFFSQDPSTYFAVLRCLERPTNMGCPVHQASVHVYVDWNAAYENMVWEDLTSIGISEEDPNLHLHTFGSDGSTYTWEQCTAVA